MTVSFSEHEQTSSHFLKSSNSNISYGPGNRLWYGLLLQEAASPALLTLGISSLKKKTALDDVCRKAGRCGTDPFTQHSFFLPFFFQLFCLFQRCFVFSDVLLLTSSPMHNSAANLLFVLVWVYCCQQSKSLSPHGFIPKWCFTRQITLSAFSCVILIEIPHCSGMHNGSLVKRRHICSDVHIRDSYVEMRCSNRSINAFIEHKANRSFNKILALAPCSRSLRTNYPR